MEKTNEKTSIAAGGIVSPVAGSRHYSSAATDWQRTSSPGFWIKPLYSDPRRGEKTLLMKVDAGAFAPLHVHEGEFEQVYVIDGAFYDQHRTMSAGDYCCRSPDAAHTSGSKEGATLMVVYTRRAPGI